jgi:putative endonuclease
LTQRRDQLGRRGEALAEAFLKRKGYEILERNWKGKSGEIDIIAKHKKTLVFAEVKTRATEKFGAPVEAVDKHKEEHIVRVANEYIQREKKNKQAVRFDVISVRLKAGTLFERLRGPEIDHIEGAFGA